MLSQVASVVLYIFLIQRQLPRVPVSISSLHLNTSHSLHLFPFTLLIHIPFIFFYFSSSFICRFNRSFSHISQFHPFIYMRFPLDLLPSTNLILNFFIHPFICLFLRLFIHSFISSFSRGRQQRAQGQEDHHNLIHSASPPPLLLPASSRDHRSVLVPRRVSSIDVSCCGPVTSPSGAPLESYFGLVRDTPFISGLVQRSIKKCERFLFKLITFTYE